MGDDNALGVDDPIRVFNRHVSLMQGVAQRQQAREFAALHGISVGDAYTLLRACQWSEAKARKRLQAGRRGGI